MYSTIPDHNTTQRTGETVVQIVLSDVENRKKNKVLFVERIAIYTQTAQHRDTGAHNNNSLHEVTVCLYLSQSVDSDKQRFPMIVINQSVVSSTP